MHLLCRVNRVGELHPKLNGTLCRNDVIAVRYVISDEILVLFPVYTSPANAYPDGMPDGTETLTTPKSPAESLQNVAVDRRISLVRGGPFYRAQEAIRLLDANRWNLGRRITLAIVVCWVPQFLITQLLNPHAIKALFSDYPCVSRVDPFDCLADVADRFGRDPLHRGVESMTQRSEIDTKSW
jgi:hypothetical protein